MLKVVIIENENFADQYGQTLSFSNLTKIPYEKGLDDQEFRCPSCRKSIGGSFAPFK